MKSQIEKLNDLKEFECAFIETGFGKIMVQRTDGDGGAGAAHIMVEDFPARDRSVKCRSPREAFERQLAVLKAHCGVVETAETPKRDLIELRATVETMLSSNYVASVEIAFEYADGNRRWYSAITNDTGVPHRYTIFVEDSYENGELLTTAKCNCLGFGQWNRCRHIAQLARVDAARMNRDINPTQLANYRARQYKRAA